MIRRLEVKFKDGFVDTRGERIRRKLANWLGIKVSKVKVVDIYTIDANLSDEQFEIIRKNIFLDPVTQIASYAQHTVDKSLAADFDYLIEVGFLPGVKDNVGETSKRAIEDLLKIELKPNEAVYTSTQYLIKGENLTKDKMVHIARDLLANELIQHWKILSYSEWKKEGIKPTIPKVEIPHRPEVKEIDLNISDVELIELNKKRSLALNLADMLTIKKYFQTQAVIKEREEVGLSSKPTDVELEVIAQTQSEHCKHRIFNAIVNYKACLPSGKKNGNIETIDSLFNSYIKRATKEIEKSKNWIVSTFWDNAGVVRLNKNWYYIVKCETHNSPSALDPFGGAITGIVGVYRDPMGTGKGSKIIAGTYGFCTGSPFYKGELRPKMHPRRLLEGIVEGVRDGGNKSGIPTPYGIVFFDDNYIGKPLVFVAAIGIMPAEIKSESSHIKKIDSEDLILMVGGRVGKDGIHGVTEASLEHGAWITAGHVQIGDPFTQKKVQDFLLEARDMGLYKCITDNGGGGLSSSIGETSRLSNGCELHLDRVPLKYEGLDPWEILLSESQERMTLAVSPNNIEQIKELARKHAVELSVLGKYTNSGKFHVLYKGKSVAYLDMEFLHGGFPRLNLDAEWKPELEKEPVLPQNINHNDVLKEMLSRINIASKEWIERQYDHEVQGGSVVKPYLGQDNDILSDAAVIRPLLDSFEGLAIAAGINPKYSKIDAYHMTACALDEAVRKVLAVGASLDQIAMNDNFCWPNSIYDAEKNPDGKHKLAQLVRANKALYEYTKAFGTPCISGKDSMFIDGNIVDSFGKVHKISGLPALQFTAVAKIDDVRKCITMDAKQPGDLVYLLGFTKDELGASEYYEMFGWVGRNVPKVDVKEAVKLYKALNRAIDEGIVSSCHGCYRGGLGIALALKAIAGGHGLCIDLAKVPISQDVGIPIDRDANIREDKILYSESPSRFIVTISSENKKRFEEVFKGLVFACIGNITQDKKFVVRGLNNKEILDLDLDELKKAWKKTFGNF